MPSVKVVDTRGGEQRLCDLWGVVGQCGLHIWKIEPAKNNRNNYYLITCESQLESIVEETVLSHFRTIILKSPGLEK